AAVAWVDCGTASQAGLGTLAALMYRRQTGKGQKVEGALLRTAIAFNNPTLVEQQAAQPSRIATVNRGQTSAPSDLFKTRDGWILALAIGEPMFRRWAKLMGEDHWLTDPRFKDDLARGDNGEVISKRMAAWAAERTNAQALTELEAAKIPSAPLYSPQQALDDEHVRKAGRLNDTDYPGVPRRAPAHHRPQRRREDHALQPDHRRARARRRLGHALRSRHHARAEPPPLPSGHRSHLPDHHALPGRDPATQRDPGAPGHVATPLEPVRPARPPGVADREGARDPGAGRAR